MTTPNNTVAGLPEKLLPCPFCGTAPRHVEHDAGFYEESVICDVCHIATRGFNEAIPKWNLRAPALASPAPSAGVVNKVRCESEQYELDAYIWKRESTQEWVLEISGDIGDTSFISRHSEPLTTPPEDVAGLPSVYAALQHPAAPSVSPAVEGGLVEKLQQRPQLPSHTEPCSLEFVNWALNMQSIATRLAIRLATPEQPGSAVQGEAVAWRREWQGSGDQRGFHIVEAVRLTHNRRIAYLGDQVSGEAVDAVIAAHNEALTIHQEASNLPSAYEWLSSNQSAASNDWMVGWDAARNRLRTLTTPPPAIVANRIAQARAFEAVCDMLDEASPGWSDTDALGGFEQMALDAIRLLATSQAALMEALEDKARDWAQTGSDPGLQAMGYERGQKDVFRALARELRAAFAPFTNTLKSEELP